MITKEIIKIASNTKNVGLTSKYNFKSSLKNRICGDKIKLELTVKNSKINSMKYETESCVFCQASASLLSKSIKNKDKNKLEAILDMAIKNKNFRKLLANKGRINCIMLPFEALQKAIYNTK